VSALFLELSQTCHDYLVWVSALFLELSQTCLDYLVWVPALFLELSQTCLDYLVSVSALSSELGRTCLDYQFCSFMAHFPLVLSTFRNIIRKPPNNCGVCIGRLTAATKLDLLSADN
jgi:hypothetical protein